TTQTRRDGLTRPASPPLPISPSATNHVWIRGYAHRESTILTSPYSSEQDLELTSDSASSFERNSSIFSTELNLPPLRPTAAPQITRILAWYRAQRREQTPDSFSLH